MSWSIKTQINILYLCHYVYWYYDPGNDSGWLEFIEMVFFLIINTFNHFYEEIN